MNLYKKYIAVSIFLLLMTCINMLACASSSPMQTIKKASDDLFSIIDKQHAAKAGYTPIQKKQIAAIAERIFDFRQIAKLSLGRNIRKFSKNEFDKFAKLFAIVLENNYIEKLEHYSGEKVIFERERILSPTKALIETKIIHNNKEIPVNYRMFFSNGRWRGYDIIIEGISLVKNYRTQFQSMLKSRKPAELIKELENKVRHIHDM